MDGHRTMERCYAHFILIKATDGIQLAAGNLALRESRNTLSLHGTGRGTAAHAYVGVNHRFCDRIMLHRLD